MQLQSENSRKSMERSPGSIIVFSKIMIDDGSITHVKDSEQSGYYMHEFLSI